MSIPASEVDPSQQARARFDQGFNCAQSVLEAFASRVDLSESQALKLASPFGGGISRRGEVCGAVSGALVALGLALGSDIPAGKEDTYRLAQDFLGRFESRHGSLLCRELLGIDINSPTGHQLARERGLFRTLCPLFVEDAAGLLQELLEKPV